MVNGKLGDILIGSPMYGLNAAACDFTAGTSKYIRITDITNDGKYQPEGNAYVRSSDERYLLRENDIVLARTGASVGKSYIYRKSDGRLIFAGFLIKISIDPEKANSRYVFECFHTRQYWNWVNSESARSGQPGVNGHQYANYKLSLPPLPEQQAIASALSDFDEHIDNLTELIEKKKAIRDGALEDLVSGKTRVDGFDGEWVESIIENITETIITGGTPSTAIDKYWGGNIPWLASTEIHQKIITRATKNITDVGLQNSSAKIAPAGSVLIALAGQGKTRGTAGLLAFPMALNQSLAALVANVEMNSGFLYYLMQSKYSYLRELSSGDGGRGGLNKTLLRGINVWIPKNKKEQQAIASILTAMDDEIEALGTEKAKLMGIREGAMDDLLTGRVRLKV